MNKAQEKIMMQKAQEYANKQGDAEYESSLEDFIEGFKQAFALYNVEKQSEQYCEHAVTDQKTLRCTCCEECGEILDVLD